MEGQYCYQYPRPAVTTDCVIFGFDGEILKVLLVERGGIIEWNMDRTGDLLMGRIEEHG